MIVPLLALSVASPFVRVQNGQFTLEGKPYKALGFTSYQLCVGNWKSDRAQAERVFRAAKAHGLRLFRATSIVFEFGDPKLDDHLNEATWTKIDTLIDVARSLDMKVIVDVSTILYEVGRSQKPPLDVTDEANWPLFKRVFDFVPNRRNTVNGRLYKDDPTIFGYSILGEIVPFGIQKDKEGNPDLKNESRDPNAYEGLIHRAAAELKSQDRNHLVNAGGLLHMAPDGPVKDRTGKPYWQTVWSDPNVDFASIHIYPDWDPILKKGPLPIQKGQIPLPMGDWKNLPTYKKFADGIKKPFMVEEWGLPIDRRFPDKDGKLAYTPAFSQAYFESALGAVAKAGIPVCVIWQWFPGPVFDIFPGDSKDEDRLVAILTRWARRFR